MLHTHSYKAEVEDNVLTWTEGMPPELKGGGKHDVFVIVPQQKHPEMSEEERRRKMKEALEQLARLNPFRDIKDPMEWQRKQRDEWERPLDNA